MSSKERKEKRRVDMNTWRRLHPGGAYVYNRKWRKKYPRKRYAQKARYYSKARVFGRRSGKPYTRSEELLILSKSLLDREIAQMLRRSLEAIQIKRVQLKKLKKELKR